MGVEIERKFLVKDDSWREGAHGTPYVQGYLARDPERTVRIRRAGERAFLTIKGIPRGVSRPEFEYEIPLADAKAMFALCDGPLVAKTRYLVTHAGKRWEVDEFHGANEGLIVAELELKDEGEEFARPSWLGREVSEDRRYANSSLAVSPFRDWKGDEKAGGARSDA